MYLANAFLSRPLEENMWLKTLSDSTRNDFVQTISLRLTERQEK